MNSLLTSIRSLPLHFKQPVLPNSSLMSRKGLHMSAPVLEVRGQIASKSPSKVQCEAGKTYAWCACGLSGKQPFCDGSHKKSALGLKPFRWTAADTKEVFFCNCKQTNAKPFCDGSHKKL